MHTASENMVRLKELTEKICNNGVTDYENVLRKLKKIVSDGKMKISESSTPQDKIKCYETMCSIITNELTNVKL